jgi:hypothetical protein
MQPSSPSSQVRIFLCKSILTHITTVKQLISSLERSGFPVRNDDSYSQAWVQIHEILAQIPSDWEATSLPIVCSLLEYGSPQPPVPGSSQRKTNKIWLSIVRHLASPVTFFCLKEERFHFSQFTKYVTSSPLVKTSDRMIFISFTSVLNSLGQLLYQEKSKFDFTRASQWGLSLDRQCGLMGSCIEKYQGAITAVYLEKKLNSPLADVDVTLDQVLKVLNSFPKYVSLVNEAVQTFADLCRLVVEESLSSPQSIRAIEAYDRELQSPVRPQEEVVALEAEIRNRLIIKYGSERGSAEATALIAAARSRVRTPPPQ